VSSVRFLQVHTYDFQDAGRPFVLRIVLFFLSSVVPSAAKSSCLCLFQTVWMAASLRSFSAFCRGFPLATTRVELAGQLLPWGAPCPGSGKSDAAPLKTLKGTIKAEGDKIRFVNDGDQKSWDVMNPEALKGHEGHHVQVSAHVYADKNAVHVMRVKMLKLRKTNPRCSSGLLTGAVLSSLRWIPCVNPTLSRI
jgi:hypothetical protein